MTDVLNGKWRIIPAPARIAVEVVNETEDRLRALGLHIPVRGVGEKPTVGKVIETCQPYALDGEEYEPIFAVGTFVIFGRYTGTEIQVGHSRVIVLRENDVLASMVPEDEAEALPPVTVNARG